SSCTAFWDYLRSLDQAGVRAIQAPPASSLGQLRNISISQANGQLVCLWDDDDLHDPSRLSWGIRILSATKAAAVFLASLMVWWPSKRLLALSPRRMWKGSMIALRHVLPTYPDLVHGEDSVLVSQLKAAHDIVLMDDPRLYCYTITGLNTFDEGHFNTIVQNARYVYHGTAYEKALDALATRIPIRTYAATLENVRPRAGFRDYSLGETARRRTTLELACLHCGRQGQYRTDQLLHQFGPDITLQHLRGRLAGCPFRGIRFQPCQIDYVDPLDGQTAGTSCAGPKRILDISLPGAHL